jgi:hypothetical protein
MREPRILIWDIETVQNLVASFQLWERGGLHLSHRNLMQERYIVCASWKWLGEKRVYSVSVLDDPKRYKKTPHDDRYVLDALHKVLSSADAIVAHNGDQYDIKFTEGRMLAQGMSPLPPIKKIDTLKIAKSRFNLNSNRLDYLALLLGLGQKKEIGGERWLEILRGGPKALAAIREMVAYNKVDIILLEKVFNRLIPYMSNAVNRQLFGGAREACTRCGSMHIQYRGTAVIGLSHYPRYQCQTCGGWDRSRTADKTVPKLARRPL